MMFFIFALLSASSFRAPNEDPTDPEPIFVSPGHPDVYGHTSFTVRATEVPSGSDPYSTTVKLEYKDKRAPDDTLSKTAPAVTLIKENVWMTGGEVNTEVFITILPTGTSEAFQDGVTYNLVRVSVGAKSRVGTDDDDVTFNVPTLAEYVKLEYTEATATTFTLSAEFLNYVTEPVTVLFTPTEGTDVSVILPFNETPKSMKSSATLTVGDVGSASVFKVGTEYTATVTPFTILSGKKWTPTSPLVTTYESLLTPVDPDNKDGAKDPITVTCTNGMIKPTLIEGENKTQTLVLTADDAKPATLSQTTDKITFNITDGQCVVSYVFNDAKIEKGTVGKAQLTLGETSFLEGALTFDGSKSVASIVAALLAVLALVF
ncbi:hypothetical protein BLNAU_17331 [Blattamonas nauphoetae]|uniref:Uncharacterized protein n=1 Tax=Blattamonas nauphoetae TaxID=2049346 RepID=A0ABQ9X7D6_9EUKA|nr:hypothetical protein BLNAU_17331 [Blattamonas nauphoetae]